MPSTPQYPTISSIPYRRSAGCSEKNAVRVDLLGHSYFAQAEALLHDIHDLIRHKEAPARLQRITPAFHEDATFWRLRR